MQAATKRPPSPSGSGGRRINWKFPLLLAKLDLLLLVILLVSRILLALTPLSGPKAQVTPEIPAWITVDLLEVNEWSRPGTPLERVNGVVVHYVGNPGTTAGQNRSYFNGLANQAGVENPTFASSNFLIGMDGEILLCVPMDEVAYCSNDRNDDTLSIEVCHPDGTGAFTPESYDALVRLVRWLADSYDLKREDILRHYDVIGKECPRWFVQHPGEWDAFLDDLQLD